MTSQEAYIATETSPTDGKDQRRLAYRDPRQDHGTRGNVEYKQHEYGTFHAPKRALLAEIDPDTQLERLSVVGLRSVMAEAVDTEDVATIRTADDYEGIYTTSTAQAQELEFQQELARLMSTAKPDRHASISSPEEYDHASPCDEPTVIDDLQAEWIGRLRTARQAGPADYYEGRSLEDDHADYMPGFTITDRP